MLIHDIGLGLLALCGVLGLIWLVQRGARAGGFARSSQAGRVRIVQAVSVDPRRRLVLLRLDGAEFLVMTGGATDLLIAGPLPSATDWRRFGVMIGGRCLLVLLVALPGVAVAQSVNIDLGTAGNAGATARIVQLTALLTVLSLAPSLLVMMTAFTRIVIVLSLLRSAIGAQGTPPNTVLIGLAMFLTYFVMQPVLDQAWSSGLLPMANGQIEELDGLHLASEPFRKFMAINVRADDLRLFLDLAHLPEPASPDQAGWRALIPSFLVSELRRAFEMGFLLYLPFLVIDMVVASVLMSLGMMMLPPNVVSLPFKLIFFVLVDGWRLVSGSLVQSFGEIR